MKINAIGVTTFGRKNLVAKKAAAAVGTLAAGALAVKGTDEFVKGVSKPNAELEKGIVRGNDDGWNPCDCDDTESSNRTCCFDCSSC